MKLYYSPGACSLGPHIALREAERSFELVRVDLKTHRTASGADYYAINPKGYVPALQLDDPGTVILTEAAVILQFIADLAPESRLGPPYGTYARYHLMEWLNFIATELHKQFGPLFAVDSPQPTQVRARAKIAERLLYLAGLMADRAFAMGESFTVADAYLFVMLRWCERFGIGLQLWPNLDAYLLRLVERPTIQSALAAEGLLETKRQQRSA